MAGFVYGGVHFGLGRHNSTLTEENEILAVKVSRAKLTRCICR